MQLDVNTISSCYIIKKYWWFKQEAFDKLLTCNITSPFKGGTVNYILYVQHFSFVRMFALNPPSV